MLVKEKSLINSDMPLSVSSRTNPVFSQPPFLSGLGAPLPAPQAPVGGCLIKGYLLSDQAEIDGIPRYRITRKAGITTLSKRVNSRGKGVTKKEMSMGDEGRQQVTESWGTTRARWQCIK